MYHYNRKNMEDKEMAQDFSEVDERNSLEHVRIKHTLDVLSSWDALWDSVLGNWRDRWKRQSSFWVSLPQSGPIPLKFEFASGSGKEIIYGVMCDT